jgi:class 3 adenylate cyclase/predicted negative regulator of RcsB-dependent stress response
MVEAAGGSPADLIRAGREAFDRHAWTEAYNLLSQAEALSPLSGRDLETLGEASFFAGRGEERLEIKERAFKAYAGAGDNVRAAYRALDLASEYSRRGRHSIASAWARRAEPLLDGVPEGYVHGYRALVRSDAAKARGELDTAAQLAEEGLEIAGRAGDADLKALAQIVLGTLKIATGAATEGIGLLEEAAFAAVSGELTPIMAGLTSCSMIAACRDLTDYERASEWLDATDKWCERQEVSGFPGVCRIHRAEIVALHGGWDTAEDELRKATSELQAYSAGPPMADGMYAIGEIRRLKGDVVGAEAALREAHALGRSPQPAMALLRLGEGQVKSAMSTIDAALREPTWDQWARARLLAAQVEIAIAGGDVQRARAAADELTPILEGYESPALRAASHEATGRVLLAEGDAAAAIGELRSAIRFWRTVGAAYEIARVRVALARALRSAGDDEDADLELRAALDEFTRLGAKPDRDATERELRQGAQKRDKPAQVHRTFLFSDIVGSTKLAEAIGDDAWDRLLRWHDDMLTACFARNGGTIVNSTGDGFFVAFEAASGAFACAIEIQRRLAEHRAGTGFAPPVRIGLHTADATVRGSDYSGVGVHIAARLGALAEGGEILASREALDEAGSVPASEPRDVTVRGVSTPITVADVDWR